jgi:glycogen debranching enzyme
MSPSDNTEAFYLESWCSLAKQARKVLAKNKVGDSTKPSPGLYPHQWNWDSAFIALGLVQYNLERAQREILALLQGQWRNGMIPQILYHPGASGYFPGPDHWQTDLSADAPPGILTSGITQPPMITIAALEVARRSGGDFARQVYPHLLAYHRWFHRTRDPKQTGLVYIIHPWESGIDNSPRWIDALMRIHVDTPPEYVRQDFEHVSEEQRPSKAEYDRFVYLLNLFRDLAYNQEEIFARSPFLFQDVLMNSILYQADACLVELASMLGQPVAEIEDWMSLMYRSFDETFWDMEKNLYLDFDVRLGRRTDQNTIAAIAPLFAGLPDQQKAQLLVEKHLTNPLEYSPLPGGSQYRVPTASKTNPYFDPVRYWRGPVWVNTNWLIIQGLKRYGYLDLARQVCMDTLRLLKTRGFYEYFDPFTGQGYGSASFSWSAALGLALLNEKDLLFESYVP